jgi:hypothetical protein
MQGSTGPPAERGLAFAINFKALHARGGNDVNSVRFMEKLFLA